jgi:TDG/mug DNA glycosylase family protein
MLPDLLAPNLLVVFVGTAPSTTSAARDHYYSHHSNKFWDLLTATGLTGDARLTSDRDREITSYRCGLTDPVKRRAASSDADLDDADFDIPGLLDRLADCKPRVVAFNGRETARRVAEHLGQRIPNEGPIAWKVSGAAAYRLPSSSATNTRRPYKAKEKIWQAFGEWVDALS